MVYSMDVDQQVHRARQTDFDKEADGEVLGRSKPRKLTGLDLAEARLSDGDIATASALARQALSIHSDDSLSSVADGSRANFILARAAALTGHPDDAISGFQKTLGASKEPRILAWSHIYLGRMLDLDCKRDEAVSEYQQALAVRDGQQDTRLAAERGVKTAYAVKGRTCDDDDADGPAVDGKPDAKPPSGAQKPQ
jgi:predicted negative regulator of RcsB-dependent stress response